MQLKVLWEEIYNADLSSKNNAVLFIYIHLKQNSQRFDEKLLLLDKRKTFED